MATEKSKEPAVEEVKEEQPAKPKKKGRLVKILALVVVLAGAGGVGWFYFREPAEPKLTHQKSTEPPMFISLETFTVNLQGQEHYLQVGIDLQISDEKAAEAIKLNMPIIRNNLLLLLSSKQVEELSTPEDKQRLGEEIRAKANLPLALQSSNQGVLGVYFTSFVIQ
ncbi:MAG: flagellar basal body-associated protein FliL [Burkholderiales bacterium]